MKKLQIMVCEPLMSVDAKEEGARMGAIIGVEESPCEECLR